jgi:hypothetical protein
MAKAKASAGLPGPRLKKHKRTKSVRTRPNGYQPRKKTGR